MIQTKTEESREKKVREQLEELTLQINKLEGEFQTVSKKIDRCPTTRLDYLKKLCQDKAAIYTKMKPLEDERKRLVNLLNTIL